jgi:hypothetical protein
MASEYEVESIADYRIGVHHKLEFLVQWKHYPATDNSWERIQNLTNCPLVFKRFAKETGVSRGDHVQQRILDAMVPCEYKRDKYT